MWDVNARVSYAFGFGQRQAAATVGPGGRDDHASASAARSAAAATCSARFGGGAEDKRIRFELFVSASNLFNTVNPIGYSGVMTSPFFGQPTAAMPARRIDLGMRVGF